MASDIRNIEFKGAYSKMFRSNLDVIGTYEQVNIHLLLAYYKYMLEVVTNDKLRSKFKLPDDFKFVDCRSTVSNLKDLQMSLSDRQPDIKWYNEIKGIRFDRVSNSVVLVDNDKTIARPRELPVGFGFANGSLMLGFGYEEKSYVMEVPGNNQEVDSGLNDLQQSLYAYVNNMSFRVDESGHIRVALTQELPSLYLYNDFVYTRTDEFDRVYSAILTVIPNEQRLGVDPLDLPNLIVEFSPKFGLMYIYTTMGIVSGDISELETPLCAWKMQKRITADSSDLDELLRKVSEMVSISPDLTVLY